MGEFIAFPPSRSGCLAAQMASFAFCCAGRINLMPCDQFSCSPVQPSQLVNHLATSVASAGSAGPAVSHLFLFLICTVRNFFVNHHIPHLGVLTWLGSSPAPRPSPWLRLRECLFFWPRRQRNLPEKQGVCYQFSRSRRQMCVWNYPTPLKFLGLAHYLHSHFSLSFLPTSRALRRFLRYQLRKENSFIFVVIGWYLPLLIGSPWDAATSGG